MGARQKSSHPGFCWDFAPKVYSRRIYRLFHFPVRWIDSGLLLRFLGLLLLESLARPLGTRESTEGNEGNEGSKPKPFLKTALPIPEEFCLAPTVLRAEWFCSCDREVA